MANQAESEVLESPANQEKQLTHFHVVSILVMIILDGMWTVIEVPQTISLVLLPTLLLTCVALGLTCAFVVTLVQMFIAGDCLSRAVTRGLVLGLAAGVPYPFVGTVWGGWLLASAGIRARRDYLASRRAA